MLVISRKVGERVAIGDDITITITEIGRGKVRLALDAPKEYRISRVDKDDSPQYPTQKDEHER